ncbi:MAG: 6-pyruvoyl tetrahydropterin synthase family protein [Gemmataceae bacterium]|nr:6-pyruvoyl tetrahydropterin synthase family protein [Gemmataceae bacterium]
MSTERYQVRVTKDHLIFSSGHFITYEGNQCERLHGHNYRTAVEVEGPLDPNHYVFDFIALKRRTQEITADLDHRMMLPRNNSVISVQEKGNRVEVRYKEKEWIFPLEDCVILPIENTTAEQLARYIAGRLADALWSQHQYRPEYLRVEVEECLGQSAQCEMRLP